MEVLRRKRMLEKRRIIVDEQREQNLRNDINFAMLALSIIFTAFIGIFLIVTNDVDVCHHEGYICTRNDTVNPPLNTCRIRINCRGKLLFKTIDCIRFSCPKMVDSAVYQVREFYPSQPSVGFGMGILFVVIAFLSMIVLIMFGEMDYDEIKSRLFGVPARGLFIVFEGIDGSGKTTQVNSLVNELEKRGYDAIKLTFPDRTTETGEEINAWLKSTRVEDSEVKESIEDPIEVLTGEKENKKLTNEEIDSLFERNMREKTEEILHALREGTWVIADRYYPSFVAYAQARGTSRDDAMNHTQDMVEPDIIFYLDVETNTIHRRRAGEENELEITENLENLEKAKENYSAFNTQNNWYPLDGSENANEVHKHVIEGISLLSRKHRYSSVKKHV